MGSRLDFFKSTFLPFFRRFPPRPVLRKMSLLQSLRSQSTQAATSPFSRVGVDSNQTTLDAVFSFFCSPSIASNRHGPAEFHFRSICTLFSVFFISSIWLLSSIPRRCSDNPNPLNAPCHCPNYLKARVQEEGILNSKMLKL
jgi:hypothetical protein